jgi:hypothetical protein
LHIHVYKYYLKISIQFGVPCAMKQKKLINTFFGTVM